MATSKLKTYRSKRDFSKTQEPAGSTARAVGNRFVVHKHHATADHYDLRLEHNGVLKSWAVPKGPSLNPADKRLAVETEDHPVEYIDFEGVIPEGEYGGGPMIVWDTGVWAPMEDADKALAKGAFKFRLSGEKLNGGWMLTRLKPKSDEDKRNWLLFKERDPAADTDTDILTTRPESVKSGRLIEELVAKPAAPVKVADLKPGRLKGSAKAPIPTRIGPQLASPISPPPDGKDWVHEIKFDGYRTAAHLSDGKLTLITRSGLDWTKRYRDLEAAFRNLSCKQAIIDGEIVVPDGKGITRLPALQDALSKGESHRLVYFAFDLLYLDGWNLTGAPLLERKKMLTQLLTGQTGARSALQYSDHVFSEAGAALYDRAAEMGLEGIISKRGDSLYVSGRSHTWTKTKARKTGDFVIAGYRTSEAAEGLAALGLAESVDGELRYVGKVGTGFDAATLPGLHQRLQGLRDGGERLEGMPKDIIPVRPVLTAHIHYGNRTSENYLAHSVFKGLRGEVELSHSRIYESVLSPTPTSRRFGLPTRHAGCSASQDRLSWTLPSITRRLVTSCCRTSSAAPSRCSAARPCCRKTASSSDIPLPECRVRWHRSRRRIRKARRRNTSQWKTPKGIWRSRSSASSSSTPGARRGGISTSRTGSSSTSTPAKASNGAR